MAAEIRERPEWSLLPTLIARITLFVQGTWGLLRAIVEDWTEFRESRAAAMVLSACPRR